MYRPLSDAAVVFTVPGEPASKSNQRRLVTVGGKPRFIKSKKALDYLDVFAMVCPRLDPVLSCPVSVTMWLTYASRRPDIDGGASLILDAMQGGILKNDRQVVELHLFKTEPSKEKPRVQIAVHCL